MTLAPVSSTTSTRVRVLYSAPDGVSFLSWDARGTGREQTNLLRPDSLIQLWQMESGGGQTLVPFVDPNSTQPWPEFCWTVFLKEDQFCFWVRQPASTTTQFLMPIAPSVTPLTLIPANVNSDGTFLLPAVASAPDFGQMLLSTAAGAQVSAQQLGDRTTTTVNLSIQIVTAEAEEILLEWAPLQLSSPELPADDPYWAAAQYGWFNVFQPTSQWGDAGSYYSAPAGVYGNNVISDTCSFALWTYADAAFWTPKATPEISLIRLVRDTIDWWLDNRTNADGECAGYWNMVGFQDANPSLIISAWDYVEVTGDLDWLGQRIADLEKLNTFIQSRDVDGDGLVEAIQTGNANALQQPNRSCCWWDAVNVGYKDGYSNALTYRAWRCLADLETKLGRTEQAAACSQLADRLKAAYVPTLWSEANGWLAWWKSQDGTLHDYATPVVNSMAIEYGLMDIDTGAQVLAKLRTQANTAGFQRPDLGIPSFLVPVHRIDYLQPSSFGCPTQADGSDTFGQYMNGGISASHSLHWMAAHYLAGESDYADSFLAAMLQRQNDAGFQDGVIDVFPKGIDWTTWEGAPCGYEGYLADNYRFLQAVMLRRAELRARFYRPLAV